ncbi:hypothetical protein P8825_14300 [Shouchella clausii]|uniref:hypothetical protein n=1 Tax=Shouchella clausii TaxID=79880 RepID=UPI002DB9B68A|nr:hypothetical protein [Shouchella clausii]MEB5480735.1 hypothetical protein [Shouchella clausii]
MAKLDGVKVIDMTAGKIEKVAYEGAEYVFTQETPKVDDIIRTDGAWSGTVEEGNFYKCVGLDVDGDAKIVTDRDNVTQHYRKHYEVFRKVAIQDPTIEARVGKLESDVATLKDEQGPTSKFKAGDKVRGKRCGFVYTLKSRRPDRDSYGAGLAWTTEEGAVYGWIGENQIELVDEKMLEVGDYIVPLPSAEKCCVTNSDMLLGKVADKTSAYIEIEVVAHKKEGKVGERYAPVAAKHFRKATVEEIVEAKVAMKPKFNVGHYAKVVGRTYLGNIKTGAVVKITKDADDDGDYKIELLDESDHDFAQASSLEKIDADKAAIIDKWAKIGREVDEYKEGDIVSGPGRLSGKFFAGEVDSVGEVLVVRRLDGGFDTMSASKATLIAPVESRVDRN